MKYEIEAKKGGKYDVIVCGGGTAGVIAAIAAGRQGAKTLLIERSFALGGMLTMGNAGITKFTEHCTDVDKYKKEVLDVLATDPRKVQVVGGIPNEFVKRMITEKNAMGTSGEAGSYVFADKYQAQYTLINMIEEAGVEVLYDTRVCLANTENDVLKSVVVVNKEGFTELFAERFIDATGDGDVAVFAGAPYNYGSTQEDVDNDEAKKPDHKLIMGGMYSVRNVDYEKLFDYLDKNPDKYIQHDFGVMSLENVKESYKNGEMFVFYMKYTFDESDDFEGEGAVQIYKLPENDEATFMTRHCQYFGSREGLEARALSDAHHNLQKAPMRGFRSLRHVPGLENVQAKHVPDIGVRETRHIIGEYVITGRDVANSVKFPDTIACGGHPLDGDYTPDEYKDMPLDHWRYYIPYRVMVPKKVENLLVAGRCVSATPLANATMRVTSSCMALGEAAGTAAALSIKENKTPRELDTDKLRKILLENGCIL